VRRLEDRLDLRPRQILVEPHADPAGAADVRWDVIDVGIAVDEHRLHPLGRRADQRHAVVAVMIVGEHRELLLLPALADEPRRHAVTRALGHAGEGHAGGSQLREGSGVTHACSYNVCGSVSHPVLRFEVVAAVRIIEAKRDALRPETMVCDRP
jgi:hypothetical protein